MPRTTEDESFEYSLTKYQIIKYFPNLWSYMKDAKENYLQRGILDRPFLTDGRVDGRKRKVPVYPVASVLDDINRSFDGDDPVPA
jgi:hypothetical protein